jgi:tryptophan 2,3-dioxygenase
MRRVAAEPEPQPSGGTDYAEYLLIDDLLRLQRPFTPGAHDELLFIVVHQVYELWFKLMLHELDLARRELEAGRTQAAIAPLDRVIAIERVLLDQLPVLETMSPEGFMEFRDPLAPASGFQSRQFRELERFSAGPLWEAFQAAAGRLGVQVPDGLPDLYRDHKDDPERAILHLVCERLLDHDEGFARWRSSHVLMVSREIGSRPGTGGSRGVEYLKGTLDRRFYPDLWELRNEL